MEIGKLLYGLWECYLSCCVVVLFELCSLIVGCIGFEESYFEVFVCVDVVLLVLVFYVECFGFEVMFDLVVFVIKFEEWGIFVCVCVSVDDV